MQLGREQIEFARIVVARTALRLPTQFDRQDLQQVGLIAALRAARTYDPSYGASWRTHLGNLITYGVLMAVRRKAWIEAHHLQLDGRPSPKAFREEHGLTGGPKDGKSVARCMTVNGIEDRLAHYHRLMGVIWSASAQLPQPNRWIWRGRMIEGVPAWHMARQLRWQIQRVHGVEREATQQVRAWMEQRGFTRDACIWA